MTRIKNFLYCLNINTREGKTDILGLLSTIVPEYIPGLFSFSINFTLLGLQEGEHLITVKFKNPDKEVISMIENAPIQYKKDKESNVPDEYMGINLAAGLQNVNFTKSGLYMTQILLDDKNMGEFEIFVKGKNER